MFKSLILSIVFVVAALQVGAQDAATAGATIAKVQQPHMRLSDVLAAVGRKTGQRFMLDGRVPQSLPTGTLALADIGEQELLRILDVHGYAAVRTQDVVTIVPDTNIRQYPLRVVDGSEDDLLAAEWVTVVLHPNVETVTGLVPVLRPMLGQNAHLAAFPETGSLVIVDRWERVQRLSAVIKAMEQGR